jgi:short-subunit dehydrogenase
MDPDVGTKVAAATEGLEVGLIVYNAGTTGASTYFLNTEYEESLKLIKLDCIGVIALVEHFGQAMRERGRGGIVIVGSMACLAGSATLTMYSAVKAFELNFAEGLWAELRPYQVDVCYTPLGMTYTPAFQRLGFDYDPAVHMLPEDAAREIIANIGNGPVYPVGEVAQAAASGVWTVDRRALVEMMSTGTEELSSQMGH